MLDRIFFEIINFFGMKDFNAVFFFIMGIAQFGKNVRLEGKNGIFERIADERRYQKSWDCKSNKGKKAPEIKKEGWLYVSSELFSTVCQL